MLIKNKLMNNKLMKQLVYQNNLMDKNQLQFKYSVYSFISLFLFCLIFNKLLVKQVYYIY